MISDEDGNKRYVKQMSPFYRKKPEIINFNKIEFECNPKEA